MTGVPLTRLEAEESARLIAMEGEIQKKVISQSEAIKRISQAVRRSRAGLKDPKKPIGSFIFAGPTGVGKTLLAKSLAEFMFGNAESLIQIDMSEYMEKHNVSRLIGAPPGYVGYEEGGQLTEKIRRRPYAVVLLDEIEKAHPDVYNMLLQIMEEGRLTDSFGRNVDFKNTIIIMTTNAGAETGSSNSFGFPGSRDDAKSYEKMKEDFKGSIEKYFRPEFLNRLDDVIVFHSLNRDNLKQIIDIELSKVRGRLRDRGLELILTPEAEAYLIDKGFNPEYGARPLRRAIENLIEDPLSEDILSGRYKGKDTIHVSVVGEDRDRRLLFEPSLKGEGDLAAVGGETGEAPASGKPKFVLIERDSAYGSRKSTTGGRGLTTSPALFVSGLGLGQTSATALRRSSEFALSAICRACSIRVLARTSSLARRSTTAA